MPKRNDHEKDLVASLFQELPIEKLLEDFSIEDIFNQYSKKFLDNSKPLSFICSCTCESLLGRSYLYTSSFLNMLVCLKRLKAFRLAYDNGIKSFEEHFQGTILGNDPLYKVVDQTNNSETFLESETNALVATERILASYSGKSNRYHMHPFKVYWFLIYKLNINKKIASVYHSSQGLIRLTIIYLLHYKRYQGGKYIDPDEIISLYESLDSEILKDEQMILPMGANHGFKEVKRLLSHFFRMFIKNTKKKDNDSKLKCLSSLTNLAIQTLRLVNEYQGKSISVEINSLMSMMDKNLSRLYNDIATHPLADFHFYDRWREKCKIIARYRPMKFIDRIEEEKDVSLFSPYSSPEPSSESGVKTKNLHDTKNSTIKHKASSDRNIMESENYDVS